MPLHILIMDINIIEPSLQMAKAQITISNMLHYWWFHSSYFSLHHEGIHFKNQAWVHI